MKVLFINRCLNGGGSERAMTLIANHFASKSIDTWMMLLSDEPHTYKVDHRINIVECFCPIAGNKLKWHVDRIVTIRKSIKKIKPDVIITFMWDINMNVILASIGLKCKIIASERCDPKNEPRKLIHFAMHFILPMADYTVFQTEQVRGYYPKSVWNKSCIIPNAISDSIPVPDRSNVEKKIVAAGRMTEQKNFSMLLQAFSQFCNEVKGYTLVIYGDGTLRNQLEHEAKKLGISEHVSMPGYVNDVNLKMRDAAMYINSSDYEGISNAMLEALAMGIPSICTDCPVGGAREVITDSVNGILVPVGEVEYLSEAMLKIANDNVLAENLSKNAIEVRYDYAIEIIGERWLKVCKSFQYPQGEQ